MGTSYVEFRGNGFWTRDPVIEASLGRLVLELSTRGAPMQLQLDWALQATVDFGGSHWAGLDDLDSATIELIVAAIPSCLDNLSGEETTVNEDWLRQLAVLAGVDDPHIPSARTSWIRPTLVALSELLEGSLPLPEAGGYWLVTDGGRELVLPGNR